MYVIMQKWETRRVWRTYLHTCLGNPPADMSVQEFVYFVKTSNGMVPLFNSIEEAAEVLPSHFETGVINTQCLVMLEQLITQVRYSFFCSGL